MRWHQPQYTRYQSEENTTPNGEYGIFRNGLGLMVYRFPNTDAGFNIAAAYASRFERESRERHWVTFVEDVGYEEVEIHGINSQYAYAALPGR